MKGFIFPVAFFSQKFTYNLIFSKFSFQYIHIPLNFSYQIY